MPPRGFTKRNKYKPKFRAEERRSLQEKELKNAKKEKSTAKQRGAPCKKVGKIRKILGKKGVKGKKREGSRKKKHPSTGKRPPLPNRLGGVREGQCKRGLQRAAKGGVVVKKNVETLILRKKKKKKRDESTVVTGPDSVQEGGVTGEIKRDGHKGDTTWGSEPTHCSRVLKKNVRVQKGGRFNERKGMSDAAKMMYVTAEGCGSDGDQEKKGPPKKRGGKKKLAKPPQGGNHRRSVKARGDEGI